MNKCFFRTLFLITILFSFQAKSVDWSGDITVDVIDQNITITGNSTIVGPGVVPTGQIAVSAVNQNIQISATDAFFVQGRTGGESDLYFYAAENRTITFDVDYDFDFKGSPDGTDMLVTFSGSGELHFKLADGVVLRFTSVNNGGGVKFFLRMQSNRGSVVRFLRKNYSNDDVEIGVGPKSLLSYIAVEPSESSNEGGVIFFEPHNRTEYVGRMILKIEDKGGVYVGGNLVRDILNPRLADIDLNTPAGLYAMLELPRIGPLLLHGGLLILNYNKTLTDLFIDPWFIGAPVVNRYGFVVGPSGGLILLSYTYLDYVGLANNICLEPDIPDNILMGRPIGSVVKKRNPSALIIDGSDNENIRPATLDLATVSGLYVRSGIGKDGTIDPNFLVLPMERTSGEGEIVVDVEGPLSVQGSGRNAIQLLSLEVTPTGGSVLIDNYDFQLFPARTFAKDSNGDYLAYNKGAFLINNKMSFLNTYLVHTDANHIVCENNNSISEPTYIGGESFALDPEDNWPYPTMEFLNSYFYVHTSVALTGLDLLIPNGVTTPNISSFTFFSNGYKKDNGSGRNMIFGTPIGSTACDGCTVINRNAHLDIFQNSEAAQFAHQLNLETSCNNHKIWDDLQFLCGPCQDEPSIHTLLWSMPR